MSTSPTFIATSTLAALLAGAAGCDVPATGADPGGAVDGKADHSADCGQGRTCLDYQSYEVLFTNPVCDRYEYDESVPTADGQGVLDAKPQNVYCSPADAKAAGSRPSSPQSRLVEWIDATGQGDSIFLAALSFSDEVVYEALCATDADVTFVVNRESLLARRLANECGRNKEVLLRGNTGGVGYAHVKLMAINADRQGAGGTEEGIARLAFGSGNMSAGTHLHHENWHFIDLARASYFVQSHVCLIDALIDERATADRGAFRDAINACRRDIPYPEEDDISAYFVPALEDRRAALDRVLGGLDAAGAVDAAIHRFTHPDIADQMKARIAGRDGFSLRMIADDDLYWLNPVAGHGERVGFNEPFEAEIIAELQQADRTHDEHRIDRFSIGAFRIKYLETRHENRQLHHNKFLLYQDMPQRDGVLCGAANFSRAGFESNLENIYYIEIPHVVAAFQQQFDRYWEGVRFSADEPAPPLATAPEKMPAYNAQP